jgi:hypothetical protein
MLMSNDLVRIVTKIQAGSEAVKNPVLPHGASSKEKAGLAIHPRSPERDMLASSRQLNDVLFILSLIDLTWAMISSVLMV